MLKEGGVPDLFAEFQAGEVAFAVRNVSIDEVKVRKLDSLEATLGQRVAVFVIGPGIGGFDFGNESIKDVLRLDFSENGGAGIAGALGAIPDFEIFRKVDFGLALLSLGFLEADDVWLFGTHEIEESSLFQPGAEAVDVPRIDFDMLLGCVCAGGGAGWI